MGAVSKLQAFRKVDCLFFAACYKLFSSLSKQGVAMVYDRVRGHEVFWDKESDEIRYRDTGEVVDYKDKRPCKLCGLAPVNGHDACIANLPGVANACCGHGYPKDSYIMFTDGTVVRGFYRIESRGRGFAIRNGRKTDYTIE